MQDGQQGGPGQVITPGNQPSGPSELPELPTIPEEPAKPETAPEEPPTSLQQSSDEVPRPRPTPTSAAHVEWTASEYVANPKSAGWFMTLTIASLVLAAVAYLITKDVVSAVVIVILGIIVGIFAARQPQVLDYKVDNTGVHIGKKFYPYPSFKSFSIAQEHAINYISLMPLKRFMPPLVIHYAPEDEDRIADTLADYLPYEDHKPDMVDNFTRRTRF